MSIDFMHRMWWKTTHYLYGREEHLYYRDSRFFDQRSPNGGDDRVPELSHAIPRLAFAEPARRSEPSRSAKARSG